MLKPTIIRDFSEAGIQRAHRRATIHCAVQFASEVRPKSPRRPLPSIKSIARAALLHPVHRHEFAALGWDILCVEQPIASHEPHEVIQ